MRTSYSQLTLVAAAFIFLVLVLAGPASADTRRASAAEKFQTEVSKIHQEAARLTNDPNVKSRKRIRAPLQQAVRSLKKVAAQPGDKVGGGDHLARIFTRLMSAAQQVKVQGDLDSPTKNRLMKSLHQLAHRLERSLSSLANAQLRQLAEAYDRAVEKEATRRLRTKGVRGKIQWYQLLDEIRLVERSKRFRRIKLGVLKTARKFAESGRQLLQAGLGPKPERGLKPNWGALKAGARRLSFSIQRCRWGLELLG